MKAQLKGSRHVSVDEVKAEAAQLPHSLSEDDFEHWFVQLKLRMERCVA